MENINVIKNRDINTPMSIEDELVRVDWYNAGEGWNGDFNPNDPEDTNLLRFDVYVKNTDNKWETVEDASYCTQVPANTSEDILEQKLRIIFDNYRDAITEYSICSLKELGEKLSWISV